MKLGAFFETRKRDNGEVYTVFADNRPQWLFDAVYDEHEGMLPDDWVFQEASAACDAIDEGVFDRRDIEDGVHEHADGRVDVYTRELFAWATDMCHSTLYSIAEDEACDMVGAHAPTEERLRMIQYCAIANITRAMITAWEENRDDESETGT